MLRCKFIVTIIEAHSFASCRRPANAYLPFPRLCSLSEERHTENSENIEQENRNREGSTEDLRISGTAGNDRGYDWP